MREYTDQNKSEHGHFSCSDYFADTNVVSETISIKQSNQLVLLSVYIRSGSRAAATSKIERFVIIVNGWKPLTIITKRSILDVAAALYPLLASIRLSPFFTIHTYTHVQFEQLHKHI